MQKRHTKFLTQYQQYLRNPSILPYKQGVGEELRVTESGGKEVWQEIAQEHLDLSKLPAGTYVFTAKQEHVLVFKY